MCPCLGLIYQVNEYSQTSFVRDTDREYVDFSRSNAEIDVPI